MRSNMVLIESIKSIKSFDRLVPLRNVINVSARALSY